MKTYANNVSDATGRAAGRMQRCITAAVLLSVGYFSHGVLQPQSSSAQYRDAVRQETFKSGGERSETVLREILKVTQNMDGTLNRMEQLLVRMESKQAAAGAPNLSSQER